jgi:hypothetical protein
MLIFRSHKVDAIGSNSAFFVSTKILIFCRDNKNNCLRFSLIPTISEPQINNTTTGKNEKMTILKFAVIYFFK